MALLADPVNKGVDDVVSVSIGVVLLLVITEDIEDALLCMSLSNNRCDAQSLASDKLDKVFDRPEEEASAGCCSSKVEEEGALALVSVPDRSVLNISVGRFFFGDPMGCALNMLDKDNVIGSELAGASTDISFADANVGTGGSVGVLNRGAGDRDITEPWLLLLWGAGEDVEVT